MKLFILPAVLFLIVTQVIAQVGIGVVNPHSSAKLEISSTSQGFLPPRISLSSTNSASPVTSPATGLLVYNTATAGTAPTNVVPGYYYWDGTIWVNITGNGVPYSGATGPVNLGNYDLIVNQLTVGAGNGGASLKNTAVGYNALSSNTTGVHNTGIGHSSLLSNTTGYNNVAIGLEAMKSNTTGYYNTAIGNYSLLSNLEGQGNTASGYAALRNSSSASGNTASGYYALHNGTTGGYNSAHGFYALRSNTTGIFNAATGAQSLFNNTDGGANTADGFNALFSNTSGSNNTACGNYSLYSSTTGQKNSAFGDGALFANITGAYLTGIGHNSDVSVDGLTNSTVIGYNARVSTSNTVSIGNSSVTSWAFGLATTSTGKALEVGSTTSNGNGAYLTTGGTWTNASSREFKEQFEDVDEEDLLEKVAKLSVTKWKYKGTEETHIGPIAEDFKELFDLGVKEDNKHISTLDAAGIALKAIQALHNKNRELQQQIDELKLLLKSK